MRRFFISLLVALVLPLVAGAQAQINTKKVKISDFTEKITKVVLSGNSFFDSYYQEEISSRWRVSPYEFCTLEEFETLKTDDNYYFLLTTKGQFRKEKEPGLQFLVLAKGGKAAEEGISSMLEIVSLPYASAENPSGRELVVMPIFLDIIQHYAVDSMDKDISAYTGLSSYAVNMSKSGNKKIVFSKDDLSGEVTEEIISTYFDKNMCTMEENDADNIFINGTPDILVSYVAAPTDPQNGSYCYKMLIDSQTHELYYYRKHRISKKYGRGFLPEDIKRISSAHSK